MNRSLLGESHVADFSKRGTDACGAFSAPAKWYSVTRVRRALLQFGLRQVSLVPRLRCQTSCQALPSRFWPWRPSVARRSPGISPTDAPPASVATGDPLLRCATQLQADPVRLLPVPPLGAPGLDKPPAADCRCAGAATLLCTPDHPGESRYTQAEGAAYRLSPVLPDARGRLPPHAAQIQFGVLELGPDGCRRCRGSGHPRFP